MSSQDWERFGEEILRNVQDAVDSRDFSRLNQTITDAVNGAADEISRNVRGAVNGGKTRRSGRSWTQENWRRETSQADWERKNDKDGRYRTGGYQYTGQTARDQSNSTYAENGAYQYGYNYRQVKNAKQRMDKQLLTVYSGTGLAKAGGTVLTAVGGTVTALSLATMIFAGIGSVAANDLGTGFVVGMSFFGVVTVTSAVLTGVGSKILGRVKRFRSYIRELGEREYYEIDELAECIRKPVRFVVKDLEKMIEKGWFKQGHLDEQRTCLMVTHKAYRQYQELMDHARQQEAQSRQEKEKQEKERLERERMAREEAAGENLSPEVREIIRIGEEYIQKIRACNDAIPGEEISAKISRMELLVDRIFDRVEKNPESVSDMNRMMNYYLPTTIKLLDAYKELDAQPVQGENILSSKKEIEKTLDTLNVAFEKLLDDLFQDTAWDLSSDISVLHTMLAQEGLTEADFVKQKEKTE